MSGRFVIVDLRAGMAVAVVAPALTGAAAGLAAGPGLAFAVFLSALGIAAAHVLLLALPLCGLLRLLGWRPGPGTVLVAAPLVGALPASLVINIWLGALAGLFGLVGGAAFCAMSVVYSEAEA